MLNNDFCDFLEYRLSSTFEHLSDLDIKGFWCDGVLLPLHEDEYSKKTINDKRQVVTTAFIGKTGQDEYELTIKFGNKALSRYAKGLSIEECVPAPEESNWYHIDVHNKQITLQLH